MNITYFYVALGGAIGAALRYQFSLLVVFPVGTLLVNVIGSFAIGISWHLLMSKGAAAWGPFVMTGVLGGFTTFSTFSLDTLRLVEAGRVFQASGYVLATVVLAIVGCYAGILIARGLGS